MSSSASRSFVPASLGSRTQLSAVVTFAAVLRLLAGRSAAPRTHPAPGAGCGGHRRRVRRHRRRGLPSVGPHQLDRDRARRGDRAGGHHHRPVDRGVGGRGPVGGDHPRAGRSTPRRHPRRGLRPRRLDRRRRRARPHAARAPGLPIRRAAVLRQRRLLRGSHRAAARPESRNRTPRRARPRRHRVDRHHCGRGADRAGRGSAPRRHRASRSPAAMRTSWAWSNAAAWAMSIGADHIHPTINAAVADYRRRHA